MLLKAWCTWSTVLFRAQQAHCLVWRDCFHWIEAKPLEMMAGLMLGPFAHLWGWKSLSYSLSHRHIGFLEEDKTEKAELYPNLIFRSTDMLMSTWKHWPLKWLSLALLQHVTVSEMGNRDKETPEMSATCSPLGGPWVPTALCKLRKLSITSLFLAWGLLLWASVLFLSRVTAGDSG